MRLAHPDEREQVFACAVGDQPSHDKPGPTFPSTAQLENPQASLVMGGRTILAFSSDVSFYFCVHID